ncbi:hypothetical protein HMPREF9620_01925 [Cutibacterium acnes HL037PA1]|nr:hypothetical protein HMPREF9620_01925 [Cutibacterium acnes HL037PA1]
MLYIPVMLTDVATTVSKLARAEARDQQLLALLGSFLGCGCPCR